MSDSQSDAGSVSSHPDLDWSQVRETVRMLNLAVAQIERSMREGEGSIETLTDSFTTTIGNVEIINKAVSELPESMEHDVIGSHCTEIMQQVQAAIMAFQFYDKLTQRLTHVSKSLEALAKLVGDPARIYSPYEWLGLQEKIKSKYTVEADKEMFEQLLSGKPIDQVLKEADDNSANDEPDIELF